MFTLIGIVGYLALLPLIFSGKLFRRYAFWIRGQQAGQRTELTKASHGAGMLAIAYFLVTIVHQEGGSVVAEPVLWLPLGVLTVWGTLWLVTSSLQARLYGPQGPIDTVILVRSLVKIAIGGAIVYFLPFGVTPLLWSVPRAPEFGILLFLLLLIAGWFIAV